MQSWQATPEAKPAEEEVCVVLIVPVLRKHGRSPEGDVALCDTVVGFNLQSGPGSINATPCSSRFGTHF